MMTCQWIGEISSDDTWIYDRIVDIASWIYLDDCQSCCRIDCDLNIRIHSVVCDRCICCWGRMSSAQLMTTEFDTRVCDHGEFSPGHDYEYYIDIVDNSNISTSCYYNLHRCDQCTDLHPTLYEDAVQWICADCAAQRDLTPCHECGDTLVTRRPRSYYDGHYHCESCMTRSDKYYCGSCNRVYSVADRERHIDPDGDHICDHCYDKHCVLCDRCDEVLWSDESDHNVCDGNHYCDECFSETYFTCECCGEVCDRDDMVCDDNGGCYCLDCHDNRHGSQHIQSYGTTQPLVFYGAVLASKGRLYPEFRDLYSGIEIEIASRRRVDDDATAGDLINNCGKFLICTEDCSIQKDGYVSGFEIPTQPFTLEWFRSEDGQKKFGHIWDLAGDYDTHAKTCGIHVNLSASAFNGKMHAYRYASFLYHPSNYAFVLAISGRDSERLNRWAAIDKFDDFNINDFDQRNYDKYLGFNTCHSNRYEIRIFASTLDRVEFTKNLEFCYSLFLYSYYEGQYKPDHQSYLAWLASHRVNFPILCQWLTENGYPVVITAHYRPDLTSYRPEMPIDDLFGRDMAEYVYSAMSDPAEDQTENTYPDMVQLDLLRIIDDPQYYHQQILRYHEESMIAQRIEAILDRFRARFNSTIDVIDPPENPEEYLTSLRLSLLYIIDRCTAEFDDLVREYQIRRCDAEIALIAIKRGFDRDEKAGARDLYSYLINVIDDRIYCWRSMRDAAVTRIDRLIYVHTRRDNRGYLEMQQIPLFAPEYLTLLADPNRTEPYRRFMEHHHVYCD